MEFEAGWGGGIDSALVVDAWLDGDLDTTQLSPDPLLVLSIAMALIVT